MRNSNFFQQFQSKKQTAVLFVLGSFFVLTAFAGNATVTDSLNKVSERAYALGTDGKCVNSLLTVSGMSSNISQVLWKKDGTVVATDRAAAPVTTIAGGTEGRSSAQLDYPLGIFVDGAGNVYVADQYNHRVQKWVPGASAGVTIAGGNGQGSAADQLNYPYDVVVDKYDNVYVTDASNQRVQKWAPGAKTGVTVAGGNGRGDAANQFNFPYGLSIDTEGNLFVTDYYNHRIQKWAPGSVTGVTVAGGKGQGNNADQLRFPNDVFVDRNGDLYIADSGNDRVQRWSKNAASAVTVAGSKRGNKANELNYPTSVVVDNAGNIYLADLSNQRIQKWEAGADSGITVAGGNGQGNAVDQMQYPYGVALDVEGNIYVADQFNHRIQKCKNGTLEASYSFRAAVAGNYTSDIVFLDGTVVTSNPVQIMAQPVIGSISGNTAICTGKSDSLVISANGGTWSSADNNIATIDSKDGSITAVSAGRTTVQYKLQDEYGCSSATSIEVVVNAPVVLAPITADRSGVCVGASANLHHATVGGTWSSSDASIAAVDQQGTVKGLVNGTAQIRYTVGGACAASVTSTITVNSLPATPVINGVNELVENTTAVFTADYAGNWRIADPAIASIDKNGLVKALSAGVTEAIYEAVDEYGCTASASSKLIVQPVPPVVADTVLLLSTEDKGINMSSLTAGRTGGTLSFYRAATGGSNANAPQVAATEGTYTLWASRFVNGVESKRVAFHITVKNAEWNVSVVNQSNYFTIRSKNKNELPLTIYIVDASGRVIETRQNISSNATVQMGSNYAKGIYYAQFVCGNQRKVVSMLKAS